MVKNDNEISHINHSATGVLVLVLFSVIRKKIAFLRFFFVFF